MNKPTVIGVGDFSVERRKIKRELLKQIDLIIDWKTIIKIVDKFYSKGQSDTATPTYPAILLFKIGLLQPWYGLRDYEVEAQVDDRISFSRFVGLGMDDKSPDDSVLSRLRTVLTRKTRFY
jgi:IS5 family transposase